VWYEDGSGSFGPQSIIVWYENTDGQGTFGPRRAVANAPNTPIIPFVPRNKLVQVSSNCWPMWTVT
jgi:hypothetical protein